MKNTLNILITGAGSAMAQSILKALLLSKYKTQLSIIFTNSEPMGAGFFMSPAVKKGYIVPIAKDPEYINAMIKICQTEQVDILFSGTEHEIFELSKAKKRFKEECNTLIMLSDIGIIEIGTDKIKTAEFFTKYQLPFPRTELFSNYQKLVHHTGYPVFMKPRIASSSRHIYQINNEEELFKHKFDEDEKILLQEYLKSEEEYTVEVFVDRLGKIVGSIVIKRELGYGLSYFGEIQKNEEIQKVCERIADKLKPMGPVNIQLKLINGRAVPFEINTRFSSTECIRAHFGFNGVEAAIQNYYFGEPVKLEGLTEGYFIRYWEECYITKDELSQLKVI